MSNLSTSIFPPLPSRLPFVVAAVLATGCLTLSAYMLHWVNAVETDVDRLCFMGKDEAGLCTPFRTTTRTSPSVDVGGRTVSYDVTVPVEVTAMAVGASVDGRNTSDAADLKALSAAFVDEVVHDISEEVVRRAAEGYIADEGDEASHILADKLLAFEIADAVRRELALRIYASDAARNLGRTNIDVGPVGVVRRTAAQ